MSACTRRLLALSLLAAAAALLPGCQAGSSQHETTHKQTPAPSAQQSQPSESQAIASQPVRQPAEQQPTPATANAALPRRESYAPRPYPVDARGFSPVDRALVRAYACEGRCGEVLV